MNENHFIVGLDIGTYYIKASAIATEDKSTVYESLVESTDNFLNIRDKKYLKQQIVNSIAILEEKIENKIKHVFLTIDPEFTKMKKSEGIVLLDEMPVDKKDIIRAIDKSLSQVKSNNDEIIDTVISRYLVDGVSYDNPIGVEGRVLEVQLKAFLSDRDYVERQNKLLNSIGLNLVGVGVSNNTASNILLTDKDKENGTFLIDVGASKTRVSYFLNNELKSIEVFPFGGHSITNDIAIVLEKSRGESEKLKKSISTLTDKNVIDSESSNVDKDDQKKNEELEILDEIIKARVIDMMDNINTYIKSVEKNLSGKKAVIHGGGIAKIRNISKTVNNNLIIPTNVITSDIIDGNSIFTFQVSGLVYSLLEVLSYTVYDVDESEKNVKKPFTSNIKETNDIKENVKQKEYKEYNDASYLTEDQDLIADKKEENDEYEKSEPLTWFQKFINKFFK